ncbi:MAG: ribosome small subunit-dependent GTPase A [Sphingobacteriales bacterium]|nr:MAG: ribosome small subunit-dependent GTPase A [Sphingobacteriales bacterium]TAF79785.1 MAG: ribosome small subunit-dependent GTPase A [Sphingobacteriales bacterium]
MQGLVIKSTGSWYTVLDSNNLKYECRIKGKFRMKGLVTTNPVAVGDVVDFEPEPEQETAVITYLHPRKNYIIRKSINLSKQAQVIAANIDLACLVVTLASPRTSLGFIDRFLVTAEAYSIPTVLIFNKLDLYGSEGMQQLASYIAIYQNIGYRCEAVSALNGDNLTAVKNLLTHKTTLFSGHSGVGKSSLINQIVPGIGLRTGIISDFSDKGKHTTTFAEMFHLPFGGKLIDTPGIRELGVVDIKKEELSHFFPEMRQRLNTCKYHNCVHINEPGCAILTALKNGEIESSRYDSYTSIYFGNDSRG